MPKTVVRMKPSQFIQAFVPIEGQPFKFKDEKKKHNWREYLYPIYDNLYKEMVLKTGRQVEKSTFQANRHVTYSILIPYFRSVYVAPTAKQASTFSNDRLRKSVMNSDYIQKYFFDQNCYDNTFVRSFTNQSKVFIGYAYHSADSMRGLSADMLNIDEFQDIISDHVPVLREILFASEYKIFSVTGTPKTFDNPLEKQWQDSTQTIWIVPCRSCGTYNRMDTEPEKMISREGLVCKKCKGPIDTRDGRWYSLTPKNRIAGFHINQLQTGRLSKPENWDDLYFNKFLKYPKAQLYNEVFGLSYDNADKPITISMMKAVSTGPWLDQIDFDVTQRTDLYMGVDWGEQKGSFNIAVIGGFIGGRFHVLHIKKFTNLESSNPDRVLDDMVELFHRFKCRAMICDHGAGHKENLRLIEKVGLGKVWEVYHSANQKAAWSFNDLQNIYVTNRTRVMNAVIFGIANGRIVFPHWEKMCEKVGDDRPYYEDFTALTKEYSETLRMIKYDHTTPDDIMQGTTYAMFGAMVERNMVFN